MSAAAVSDPTVQALTAQSEACRAMGSPFSARLLALAAEAAGADGPVRALFAPWEGAGFRRQVDDAVALRFLGALHDLALSGEAPNLAACYAAFEADGAWSEALVQIAARADHFTAFMAHEPQTNETRRSICLLGGFLTVARESGGLPLRVFELGASAGLNQNWDRFAYDLGGASWGDAAGPVHMDADWRGPLPPLDAPLNVVSRAACDRKPVDLADPLARRRLRAYIWPDQAERLARLDAAIALALNTGVAVEAADAADWTAARVTPLAGAATVVFHSIFWSYLPPETARRLEAAIGEIGERAAPDAPVAWLRMEPVPTNLVSIEVRLTMWPGGDERLIARCHPHGAWVEWLG